MNSSSRLQKQFFFACTIILCGASFLLAQELTFSSDFTIFAANHQKADIQISIFVPYSQLHFTISDSVYRAEVDISAILYQRKKQKGGEIWRKEIVLDDFDKTNSNKEGISWTLSIRSLSGKFDMHIRVKDVGTKRKGEHKLKIEVPDFMNCDFWVSKPGFLLDVNRKEKGWILSGNLFVEYGTIYSLIQVVTDPIKSDSLLLSHYVIDENDNRIDNSSRYFRQDSIVTWQLVSFPIEKFKEGSYTILVEISKDARIVARNSKQIAIAYPFFSSKLYAARVEQMLYITNDKEAKELKESSGEDREKVWNEFWSKKDPIPQTPENETSDEYFRRVDYANEHFRSFQSGWRTDRGKVYIIYGKPDEIEYHPFETEVPSYEIWFYYNLGRKFIFADLSMTGDYTQIKER